MVESDEHTPIPPIAASRAPQAWESLPASLESRASISQIDDLGARRLPTHLERYRAYIRQLAPGLAGRLDLDPGELPERERARLANAARAEGVPLEIHCKRNVVVFWKTRQHSGRYSV